MERGRTEQMAATQGEKCLQREMLSETALRRRIPWKETVKVFSFWELSDGREFRMRGEM